jgi:hypothetical protein
MDLTLTRDYMITNKNLNTMLKPNNISGQYTKSIGMNSDAGISILNGKFNHHMAIVFDIIYDRMYRMFNQLDGMNYIAGSLTKLLSSNDGKRKKYFTKLLTERKLEFLEKIEKLILYSNKAEHVPYNTNMKNYLLNSAPDIIDNAFPMDFSLSFRNLLETKCALDENFDEVLKLIKKQNFGDRFFIYLLRNIFYGKLPSIVNPGELFLLEIKLNSIFDNDERSIYVIKDWFQKAQELKFNMTYPVTCMSHCFDETKYIPKKLILQSYMMPLQQVNPITDVKFKKSSMSIVLPLTNKFMAYFAHDAKLCVRTYVPSKLYEMNNNAFFIGKNLVNNNFYRKKGGYQNRLNYRIDELFDFLNLPLRDTNQNNTHRRKAIFKALDQLEGNSIIGIDKMNSERIKLSKVWNLTNMPEGTCKEVELDKSLMETPIEKEIF